MGTLKHTHSSLLWYTLKTPQQCIYLDHDTAAAHHLAGFALTVDLAETNPLAELLIVINLDQVDLMLSAEGLHQLDVHGLVAVGCKDAEMGLTLVEGLSSLTDTTGEAIVDECGLQHFRESGVDIHHTSGSDAVKNR